MRSAASLAAAVLLCGCGNFSTEDLEFHEALPTRETLQVVLPAPALPAGAQAAVTCASGLGEATGWTEARTIGVSVNAGLDWILRVVDLVRSLEPTRRETNRRSWGPFPDGKHPGIENRIVVWREFDPAGTPTYHFAFEARRPAQPIDWTALITGDFEGAYAARGRGTVTLHFDNIRALAVNDNPTDPAVAIPIGYDRRGEPRTLTLTIPAGAAGLGLIDFPYTWSSWNDGQGRFDYAVRDQAGNRVVWAARFAADGAGRGDVVIYPATPPPVSYPFSTCWDASGCYVGVNDPFNVTRLCGTAASCVVDWPAACPTAYRQ